MKTTKTLFQLMLALVCTTAIAQEKAASPEEAAWMEYMKPGAMHENFAKSNGMWTEDITMWMAPGAPEMKSKATVMNKMIMGGRYQQGMHRGSIEKMPFEGMSLLGYDNAKKKIVSTWIDNMGTGIMYMEGDWNEAEKTCELSGMQIDPVTGKELPVRETFKIVDDNHQVMEMFMTTADGKEFKSMHIELTRKEGPDSKSEMAPAKGETPVKQSQPKMQAAPAKGEKK